MNTRIREYKRGDKRVNLIGVMHIGTSAYYEQIQDYLNNRKLVLFERVSTNEDQRLRYSGRISISTIASALGLKTQLEGINYNPKWINSDLSLSELEIINGGELEQIKDKNIDKEDFDKYKNILKPIIKLILTFPNAVNLLTGNNYLLVESRNMKVILDIIKHIQNNNEVNVLYGEAYMKQIGKTLNKMGFELENQIKINPLK